MPVKYVKPKSNLRKPSRAPGKPRPSYRRPQVRGRGGYWYVGGSANVNASLGKYGKVGASVDGGYANKQVSRQVVTGKGAYQIKRNVLYEGASIPEINNSRRDDGAVVIRHSEYICDIVSSSTIGAFGIQTFDLNPGLAQTFEYLSQLAGNFTEYRIEGMLVEFRTRSVDALNSTNTSLGSVYIATQYNSLEPNFTSKAEMSSYQYCNNCKPSESMLHVIECDPKQTALEHLYIRTGSVPATADIRLYDIGRLQVATQGMQASSVNIGELHITYQVALYKPRLYQALGYLNDAQFYRNLTAISVSSTSILGNNNDFGDPSVWSLKNNMPMQTAGWKAMASSGATNCLVLRAPRYPMGIRMLYVISWEFGSAQTQNATQPIITVANGAKDVTSEYILSDYSQPLPGVSSSTWSLRAVIDFEYSPLDSYAQVQYQGTFPTSTCPRLTIFSIQIPNTS